MSTTLMQKDPTTGHYTVVAPQGMRYGYDQLNRIATATAFSAFAGNSWQPQTSTDAYLNTFTYDANGNILKQLRNSADAATNYELDNLTYNYYPGTNRLASVNDVINAGLLADDIDNQASNNYEYDEIGNLIYDTQGGITSIGWTVYGKIREINKSNNTLNFTYAPDGNRVSKLTNNGNTYYVRDASGNIMATYTLQNECLTVTEHHLYGSSRLGTRAKEVCVNDGTVEDTVVYVERGYKRYELSNHLGNVLTTISDKRLCHTQSGSVYYTAHMITVTDYYPFGSPMASRTFEQDGYRFGFNGKENDNDLYGDGNALDFGARIYDSRLGRWLSVDPEYSKYPDVNPYCGFVNNPIIVVDDRGDTIRIIGTESFKKQTLSALQLLTNDKLALRKDGTLIITKLGTENSSKNLKFGTELIRELNSKGQEDSNMTEIYEETLSRGNVTYSTNPLLTNKKYKSEFDTEGVNGPGGNSIIYWDTKDNEGGVDENGSFIRPTFIGLGHELIHAKHNKNGTNEYDRKSLKIDQDKFKMYRKFELLPNYEEEKTRDKENIIRTEQGLTKRKT